MSNDALAIYPQCETGEAGVLHKLNNTPHCKNCTHTEEADVLDNFFQGLNSTVKEYRKNTSGLSNPQPVYDLDANPEDFSDIQDRHEREMSQSRPGKEQKQTVQRTERRVRDRLISLGRPLIPRSLDFNRRFTVVTHQEQPVVGPVRQLELQKTYNETNDPDQQQRIQVQLTRGRRLLRNPETREPVYTEDERQKNLEHLKKLKSNMNWAQSRDPEQYEDLRQQFMSALRDHVITDWGAKVAPEDPGRTDTRTKIEENGPCSTLPSSLWEDSGADSEVRAHRDQMAAQHCNSCSLQNSCYANSVLWEEPHVRRGISSPDVRRKVREVLSDTLRKATDRTRPVDLVKFLDPKKAGQIVTGTTKRTLE